MSGMRWLNTSGAPVLLVPRRVIRDWRGILLREPRSSESMVDFVDEQGIEWFIHDEFNFQNPKTDYDRLCGSFVEGTTELLLPIGDATALAISDGSDSFAWWPEGSSVLTGAEQMPSADLSFEPLFELEVRDDAWVLMNSAVAGVQVLGDEDDDEWTHVTLQRGRYRVDRAARDGGSAYRLTRSSE
jgi:hypothetical protein